MPLEDPDYYVDLARRAILELLDRELAAPNLEIVARIADEPWPGLPSIVEPMHVHDAGLGFLDLIQVDGPDELITRRLTHVLPRNAARVAAEWAITAADNALIALLADLRTESRVKQRSALVASVRVHLRAANRYSGGW